VKEEEKKKGKKINQIQSNQNQKRMMMMEENSSIKSAVSSMSSSAIAASGGGESEIHHQPPQTTSLQQQNGDPCVNATTVSVRIYVPELNVQKVIHFHREELVWNVKQQCLASLPKVSFSIQCCLISMINQEFSLEFHNLKEKN
jgi:hypothetical protein